MFAFCAAFSTCHSLLDATLPGVVNRLDELSLNSSLRTEGRNSGNYIRNLINHMTAIRPFSTTTVTDTPFHLSTQQYNTKRRESPPLEYDANYIETGTNARIDWPLVKNTLPVEETRKNQPSTSIGSRKRRGSLAEASFEVKILHRVRLMPYSSKFSSTIPCLS